MVKLAFELCGGHCRRIMSTEIAALSDKGRLIKTCALQGFQTDPDDPKRDEKLAAQRKAHGKEATEHTSI